MDNNTINNHICNNTSRSMDRSFQRRIADERGILEELLRRGENRDNNTNNTCDTCNTNNTNNTNNTCNTCNTCNTNNTCNSCEIKCKYEHGGEVFVTNIGRMAYNNQNFRQSIWTGRYLQSTLMSIPCGDDVGTEVHEDTDQYIRVEQGNAVAMTGNGADCLYNKYRLCAGDVIFIPAGTWHNIVNAGRRSLKLSSVYAPPHHPRCTVEKYK